MLRTETITALAGAESTWQIEIDGTLSVHSDGFGMSAFSYGNTAIPSIVVYRGAAQFVWPNTLTKSPEGSVLDPPVLASINLSLDADTLVRSGANADGPLPTIKFYMALVPTLVFDGTFWPGPVFESPWSAPTGNFVVHEFADITPRINGNRVSMELVSGVHSYNLDASQMSRVMNDQPGKDPWNLKFTVVCVMGEENDGYPVDVDFPSKVTFALGQSVLTIDYISAHTGFMTNINPATATRAVRDGRFGRPALSMELVEDKYNLGVQVGIKQQDPDDGIADYSERQEQRTDNKGVR